MSNRLQISEYINKNMWLVYELNGYSPSRKYAVK